MPKTNFRALHIAGLNFQALSADNRLRLADSLIKAAEGARWWTDSVGPRFSLAKGMYLLDRYVVGSLTQQHNLERHIYTDDKEETDSNVDSYEDRLFLLDLLDGQLIVEWRQFRAKPPLSTPLMITRLERVLQDTLVDEDSDDFLTLSPYQQLTSKAELLVVFYAARVLEVEVKDVGRERIPDDVQLVNPNPHLEGALRELLLHDAGLSAIEEFRAQVGNSPQGDLRRSAIVRGAMHSGQPTHVTFQEPNGVIRVRREYEKGIVTVEVPTLETDSPEERLSIAATLIHAVSGLSLVPPSPGTPTIGDNLELFDDE